MAVYLLLSSAAPALQAISTALDDTNITPTPTTRRTITPGGTQMSAAFNQNATKDDNQGRFGGGAWAVNGGLDLVADTFPNFHVTAGEATIDGPVTVTANVAATATNATRNYVWLSNGRTVSVVTGSTSPPAGNQVYLGSFNPSGSVFDTPDYSGRPSQVQGNAVLVQSADLGVPAWTPPGTIRFYHKTLGGLYWWDGGAWWRVWEPAALQQESIASGASLVIPAGYQAQMFNALTVRGALQIRGHFRIR